MQSQKILICNSPDAELSPEESFKILHRCIVQKKSLAEVKKQLVGSKLSYEKNLSPIRPEISYVVVQKDGTIKHRKAVLRIIEQDKERIRELMAEGMTYKQAIDYVDNTRQVLEPEIVQKDTFDAVRWRNGMLQKTAIISYPALYLQLKPKIVHVERKKRARKGERLKRLAELEGIRL